MSKRIFFSSLLPPPIPPDWLNRANLNQKLECFLVLLTFLRLSKPLSKSWLWLSHFRMTGFSSSPILTPVTFPSCAGFNSIPVKINISIRKKQAWAGLTEGPALWADEMDWVIQTRISSWASPNKLPRNCPKFWFYSSSVGIRVQLWPQNSVSENSGFGPPKKLAHACIGAPSALDGRTCPGW